MENILKFNLIEISNVIIRVSIITVCFVIFLQFTQQSVSNSLTRNTENQNNHVIFALNY